MRLVPTTIAALGVLHGASGQTIRVKSCRPPSPPVGYIRGTVQVSFLIDSKGRPDTSSLRAVGADSISMLGARSAATRQLAGCTFEEPPTGRKSQSVIQTIHFIGPGVTLSSLRATAELEQDIAVLPPPLPAEPLEVTDTLLEEHPRQFRCARGPIFPPISSSRSQTPQSVVSAVMDQAREYSGSVTARVTVGADGKVEPGSVTIVSSTNPSLTNIMRPVIASCEYAPGRISGVPVRTFMTVVRNGFMPGGE